MLEMYKILIKDLQWPQPLLGICSLPMKASYSHVLGWELVLVACRCSTSAMDYLEEVSELARARTLFDQGELSAPEAIYRELLDNGSQNPEVFNCLAVICGLNGREAERSELLKKAVFIKPDHALYHQNLGISHQQQGQFEQALACYQRAIEINPGLIKCIYLSAVIYLEQGDRRSEECLRKVLELEPLHREASYSLGTLLMEQNRYEEAIDVCEHYLSKGPSDADISLMLGALKRKQGYYDDALTLLIDGHNLYPDNLDILVELGLTQIALGAADDAMSTFLCAAAIEPENSRPIRAVGYALQSMNRIGEAIDLYQQALSIDPENADIMCMLGTCYTEIGHGDTALDYFKKGIEIDPNNDVMMVNLAGTYQRIGKLNRAIELAKQVNLRSPECLISYHALMFFYSIGPAAYAQPAIELSSRFWEIVRKRQSVESLHTSSSGDGKQLLEYCNLSEPRADNKIHIGFLSAEIGEHVVSLFLSSFLHYYDRSRFEVDLISSGRRYEEREKKISSLANNSLSLQGLTDSEAQDLLSRQRYDILVDTSGFTNATCIELLAKRCAPVQCHYMGFHATTGLDTIDYFIGDQEFLPEAFANQFVERFWQLPRTWLAYTPNQPFPKAESIADSETPILGSFNQLAKVREETLSYWVAALKAIPSAKLAIKDRGTANKSHRELILSYLYAEGGISEERVYFLPVIESSEEHLKCYNFIDVALDATPWSSSTTAFEALAMGVPLVSIRGDCPSARMSSSILRGCGHAEWIAESPDKFAQIVRDLCGDHLLLRKAKASLQDEILQSSLFDADDLSNHLGRAFLAMAQASR